MEQLSGPRITKSRRSSLGLDNDAINIGIPDSPTLPRVSASSPLLHESCIPVLSLSDDNDLNFQFPYASSIDSASSLLTEVDDAESFSTTTATIAQSGDARRMNLLTHNWRLDQPQSPTCRYSSRYGYPSPPPTAPPPPIPEPILRSAFSSYSDSGDEDEDLDEEENEFMTVLDPFWYDRSRSLEENKKKTEPPTISRCSSTMPVSEETRLLTEFEKKEMGDRHVYHEVMDPMPKILVWRLLQLVWNRIRKVFVRHR